MRIEVTSPTTTKNNEALLQIQENSGGFSNVPYQGANGRSVHAAGLYFTMDAVGESK